ncbi:MAG: DNA replication/repair protein RecF [Candidatus Roizmanbacteria bacterium]|nr:MAG: DNA replication/repair protein RecF [Candidatus Roizmanbacteria bacterium]
MIFKQITVTDFRNFDSKIFDFHPSLTIIIGENARGKTNLLEAIFLSINGAGFRESKEEELITLGKGQAVVEAEWEDKKEEQKFQIVITKRGETIEKKFFVNKTKKGYYSYSQYQIKSVLFAPEHIDIINGSPDKRREYFNRFIAIFDPEYKKKVHNYEHALYKRNKILEHHTNDQTLKEELLFWNDYLEKQAVYISAKRQEYSDYLNDNQSIDGRLFRINYLKNELTQELLNKVYDEEKRLRRTLIGPQKDDFQIHLNDKNVHHFGSRSEQRLAVFWLKLNEINYLTHFFKKKPILLLDDIFSELDTKNKKVILDLIGNYQTVLTTTEKELLDLVNMPKTVIQL